MRGMDTTPLYKIDTSRRSDQHFGRAMSYAQGLQRNVSDPEPTIGAGLMTGLGGAAAGASVATAAWPTAAAAGPIGLGVGAGIGLLSAFG